MLLIATLVLYPAHAVDGDAIKSKPGFESKVKPSLRSRVRMPDSPNEAAAFWYGARVSENGEWPKDAVMTAKHQRDRMLEMDGGGVSAGSWSWLGPGNVGGRLRAILIHPANPSIMWAGSVGGGVWKTTNGGASWAPMDDFMAAIGVGCMALDPADPNHLYAGTGEGFFNTGLPGSSNNAFRRGAGIFKSEDGGTTWNRLTSTETPAFYFVNRIAICPTNRDLILAATNDGIYRSTDRGVSFSLVQTGKTYDLRFHPTDPLKAIAGRSNGTVMRTIDGGLSWLTSTGSTGARVEVTYFMANPEIVFAAISNNGRIKIWRSDNGGATFVVRTSGNGASTYANYNTAFWVDPTNSQRMILGGVNLYRSTDGGVTISSAFSNVHADHHTIVAHPQFDGVNNRTVFFGHDGGISRANDFLSSATTDLNNNLGITQFYGAGINNTSGVIVAGAQDNGSQRFSGNVQGWVHVLGGDGISCAADQTDPNYFYASYQHAAIQRSSNAGQDFSASVAPPGSGGEDYNFATYFMLDPNLQTRMYVCGARLYRADNVKTGGPTWIVAKEAITDGGSSERPKTDHFDAVPPRNISTVAVAEGNPNLVWVGHNNGQVWKSVNALVGTPTWERMDDVEPLPQRFVSRIVIDRNDHNRVFVSYMGWESNNVWRTTDGGVNWDEITGTAPHKLPSAPVGAFAQHRTKPNWLYAGTDVGMFTSSDGGATWSTYTDGPGTVPMAELIWRNDSTLIAVTHGRGVFSAIVDPSVEPVSPRAVSIVRGILPNQLQLQDVIASDDQRLVVQPGVTFSSTQAPIEIEFTGTAPTSGPTSISLQLEGRASSANVGFVAKAFNYSLGQWMQVGTSNLSTTDSNFSFNFIGNASNYVESGTRTIKVRLEARPTGAIFAYPWRFEIDRMAWTLGSP
jgi:hypothetical protein